MTPQTVAVVFVACAIALTAIPAVAADFLNVTYHRCYDGDTCTVTIPDVHPVFGLKIRVRVAGIDTPEIRGKCASEKSRAIKARDAARTMMANAEQIDLRNVERGQYFRIVADVMVDGVSLGERLIEAGLARRYDGGKRKGWCG